MPVLENFESFDSGSEIMTKADSKEENKEEEVKESDRVPISSLDIPEDKTPVATIGPKEKRKPKRI